MNRNIFDDIEGTDHNIFAKNLFCSEEQSRNSIELGNLCIKRTFKTFDR